MIGLSLFSGIGGFEYGFQIAVLEVRPVGYIEINPYCQEVLKARFGDGVLPDAPIWPDIRAFDGKHLRGLVDIVYGGFPCQPHSTAGRRLGEADPRNLWPETAKVIGDVRPRYVLLENAGIHLRKGRRPAYAFTVLADLAALGYVGVWGTVGAHDVGAPHKRDRWWCLAHTRHDGSPEQGEQQGEWAMGNTRCQRDERRGHGLARAPTTGEGKAQEWERVWTTVSATSGNLADDDEIRSQQYTGNGCPCNHPFPPWPPCPSDRDAWAEVLSRDPSLEPALCGMANGIPNRRKRLAALGNAVVPSVAAQFLRLSLLEG